MLSRRDSTGSEMSLHSSDLAAGGEQQGAAKRVLVSTRLL